MTLLYNAIVLYILVLFARIILEYIPVGYAHPVAKVRSALRAVTEPLLAPIRSALPPVRLGGVALDLSPIVLIVSSGDSLNVVPDADVPVGSMDTVSIDVTAILRNWQTNDTRPHSIVLRTSPEAGTLGTLIFGSSRTPGMEPSLRLTYVNPFRFEGSR